MHAAALVKRWTRHRTHFDRVNVEATARLFELARSAGVAKILYCSSFIALGPTDGTIGDEDTVHDGRPRNDYERTKRLADIEARRRQGTGEPIVVLYPGVVYVPGKMTDGNILGGVARDLLRGRFPGTVGPGDRRQCLAFVEDVARGFVFALEKAVPGSRYVLSGENVTVRAALELIGTEAGVRVPRRKIPYGVAAFIGRALRWQAYAERVLRAGASGYIMKQEVAEEFVEAIRKVLSGGIYLSERMSARMLQKLTGREPTTSAIESLSDRELEILRLVAQCLSPREIATRLCLSIKTVETHLDHVKTKLGLESSREVFRYAILWFLEGR